MKIATFSAKCRNISCKYDFNAPALSDFSYGEYIYGSMDSREIRYYSGLGCETWDLIDRLVSVRLNNKNREKIGSVIQKIVGLVADRQNPDVYFTQDIYCPKCQSKRTSIDENDKMGLQEYESLTFDNFTNLNELEKERLIDRYLREI